MTSLGERGWAVIPFDPRTAIWAEAARGLGAQLSQDPDLQAKWLQCQGTWFVGVDVLPNDPSGAIGAVPLAGTLRDALGDLPALHPAQLSIVYPGYPRPRKGESDAAFRYRQRRDAAHVDGLLRDDQGHRHLAEPHAFILGLPLNACSAGASPLVVWDQSHEVMRAAFRAAFAAHPQQDWPTLDVAEVYQAARRRVFETCARIEIAAQPGEAILLHRMTLHGMAPWAEGAKAPAEGRMIAYFRPILPGGIAEWLKLP
ncbi:hypothetical protein [Aestuariicoccus sp. MJ-SS9]|uniref:hypothetical protein n=1 Tax=Aestuariicoccus sp. MJ-SS9 TaxID=3079855 RepID=UPI00290EBD4A|nr:hypothetical protein [Aestuariicoccus sp. MJ-SS9]MDU8912559.1 hypothetical protein [Aestuariicoccus sp. MJ-SS9]